MKIPTSWGDVIEVPDGSTPEFVHKVVSHARAQRGKMEGFDPATINPLDGVGAAGRFRIGAGQAFDSMGRGAAQLAVDNPVTRAALDAVGIDTSGTAQKLRDLQAEHERQDKPLNEDGAAIAGNLAAYVAPAILPSVVGKRQLAVKVGSLLPAAATKGDWLAKALRSGKGMLKGAAKAGAIGAGWGLTNPYATDEQRAENAGIGAITNMGLRGAVKGVQGGIAIAKNAKRRANQLLPEQAASSWAGAPGSYTQAINNLRTRVTDTYTGLKDTFKRAYTANEDNAVGMHNVGLDNAVATIAKLDPLLTQGITETKHPIVSKLFELVTSKGKPTVKTTPGSKVVGADGKQLVPDTKVIVPAQGISYADAQNARKELAALARRTSDVTQRDSLLELRSMLSKDLERWAQNAPDQASKRKANQILAERAQIESDYSSRMGPFKDKGQAVGKYINIDYFGSAKPKPGGENALFKRDLGNEVTDIEKHVPGFTDDLVKVHKAKVAEAPSDRVAGAMDNAPRDVLYSPQEQDYVRRISEALRGDHANPATSATSSFGGQKVAIARGIKALLTGSGVDPMGYVPQPKTILEATPELQALLSKYSGRQ